MKKTFSRLVSVLMAIVLLISALIVTNAVSTPKRLDYKSLGFKNAYEYLLDRDGFIYGIDYDWMFTNTNSSHNLGDNKILNQTSAYNEYLLTLDVYNMRALGFNCMNMWLFMDGQGLDFNDDGLVIGLTDVFKKNLRGWLEICRKTGIFACVSIQPHGEASNYGNGNGKETPREIFNKYFRFYFEPNARKAYMENAIRPLCDILSEYQDVVAICSLTVENTSNLTDDAEIGYFRNHTLYGTTWENMFSFMKDMNSVIKDVMPNMITSTENMGDSQFQYRCNELGVDLIGQNRYNSDGMAKDPVEEYLVKPTYIGEFNGGESGFDSYSQEYWGKIKANFYPSAQSLGYKGAFYFSYSTGGAPFNLYDSLSTNYDKMRSYALTISYQINDMMKKYKKDTTVLDKPVLLFNKGGNDVYWLPGRGVTTFKLERSDDNGETWKTIEDNIDVYDISLTNGLCKFTDTSLKEGITFQYRVTAYNDEGDSIVSLPNNSAEYFVAKELLKDGGFENVELKDTSIDTGWYGTNCGKVVKNEELALEGTSYLECDKANGLGLGKYGCVYQKVKVSPNTTYSLTFNAYTDVKAYMASVQVYNAKTNTPISGASSWFENVAKTEEHEWKSQGILFSTGDFDEIIVRISNGEDADAHFKLDNFSLKESR